MARELCPLCEMRGKVSPLSERKGVYGCSSCSRIYTPDCLAEAKKKQAREWEHRIALIRAGSCPGFNMCSEGVTRAGQGESARPATAYVVSSLG
jgi:hypothetical protein